MKCGFQPESCNIVYVCVFAVLQREKSYIIPVAPAASVRSLQTHTHITVRAYFCVEPV